MNEGGEHGAWTARYNEPTLCMALQKYGFMVCPGFMSPGMEYKNHFMDMVYRSLCHPQDSIDCLNLLIFLSMKL